MTFSPLDLLALLSLMLGVLVLIWAWAKKLGRDDDDAPTMGIGA